MPRRLKYLNPTQLQYGFLDSVVGSMDIFQIRVKNINLDPSDFSD